MMEHNYGYKKTLVSGTEFTIKHSQQGTRESSAGRKLATRDDVTGVDVEYDGTITFHVRRKDGEAVVTREYVPEDFNIVGVMIHDSDGACAHIDIKRL